MSDLMISRFQPARTSGSRVGAQGLMPSLRVMLRTYLTRQALSTLSARECDDIGISASAAVAEAARLPWDVAARRRRQADGIGASVQHFLEDARKRRLSSRMQNG